jgi:D-alanyl-D-alanine carboxypeptidase
MLLTTTRASYNLSDASIGGSYAWTISHRTVRNLILSNAFGSWRVDSVPTTSTFLSFKISSMRSRARWPLGKNRILHCLVYAALLKTLCLVASLTKVFVTTGVFLLIQDGKLHLDDKITQIVPGLPASWSDITVLNCLSHTSGIPEIVRYRPGGFQWLAGTQEEALKLLSSIPLEHKPGEKSGHNGTEFLVVKMIVEKVSGMRLQDFLEKRIFEPLHLESARYGDTLDIIPNRVSFYTRYTPSVDRSVAFDRWDELVVSDSKIWNYRVPYPEWLYGAAGLNISALDLAKFDAALTQGQLLNKRLLEQMWTPYRLTDGELGRFTAGWMTRMWNGHQLVFHLGGDLVIYAHLPDEGISVIWLTNLDPSNPYDVMSGILQRNSH